MVQRGQELLLHRRSGDARWLAGRWQLPTIELPTGRESPGEAAALLGVEFGGTWECEEEEVEVRHTVTWRDFAVRAALARWSPAPGLEPAEEPGGLAWFGGEEIEGLPSSSLLGKTLARLSERGKDLTVSGLAAGVPSERPMTGARTGSRVAPSATRVAAPIHSAP